MRAAGACKKWGAASPVSNRPVARLPQLFKTAVSLGGAIWAMRICLKYLDPYREQRDAVSPVHAWVLVPWLRATLG